MDCEFKQRYGNDRIHKHASGSGSRYGHFRPSDSRITRNGWNRPISKREHNVRHEIPRESLRTLILKDGMIMTLGTTGLDEIQTVSVSNGDLKTSMDALTAAVLANTVAVNALIAKM
jgi:hypothetical protein